MARKRKSNDEGGINLDSLMDALTNVVAVLILVLILVQADASQKVVQFLEDLIPATPEEVVASTQIAENLDKKKLEIEKLLTEDAPDPEQVEAERRQLELLQTKTKENQDLLADLEELKKLEEKKRKERDAENKISTAVQKQISKLEALLDQTKLVKAIPPTVVSIPTSRAIPKNAKIYHVSVINNRVHFFDPFTPMELFEREFKKHKRDWLIERVKRPGADRYIYNQAKIAQHFEKFDFKNSRKQTIKVNTNPVGHRMTMTIRVDPKAGGTAAADLASKNSIFKTILRKLSSNRRVVVMFHVHPGSFNTYLKARTITDKARVAAGWEVKSMYTHWMGIKDVEVKRLKDPPPPPVKPVKPKPPGPPVLPPKLD